VSRRVFLHVGSPKTGTTFLQQVLWSQRDLAHREGVLLPGRSFFDHYLATLDVRAVAHLPQHPRSAAGSWDRLVEESQDWPDTVVVSHELFAAATAEQAQRAITSFGDREVHVVMTARDLVRQIPAEWQEHIKHRSSQPFSGFVRQLVNDTDGKSWFWQVQDVAAVLARWGATLPPSQVHVVVVPPAGADPAGLWNRFASLVGLEPEAFDLEGSRANTSLRGEQAELLRRVNSELGDRLPLPGPYPEIVKNVLAHQVLAGRPGTPYGLDGPALDFAVTRSKQMAQEIEDLGVHVVGDLAELVPGDAQTAAGPVARPRQMSDAALLDEAVAALAEVLDRFGKERARANRLRAERDYLQHQRPLRYALIRLSNRSALLTRLVHRYRRGRDRLLRSRAALLRRAGGK
jgi:hypothetical protein